jgi:hypothetical protein
MPVKFIFDADSARFIAGSFARLSQTISGSLVHRVLAFSDTNTERALFSTTAPSGWSGSIAACVVGFPASATTNSVVWELSVMSSSPGVALSGSNFATTASVSASVTGASQWMTASLAIVDNGIAGGYKLDFLLRRLPTHATDTAASDMYFHNLVIADGR